MAMINCAECGKEVSDKAEICLNCGVKVSLFSEVPVVNIQEEVETSYELQKKSTITSLLLILVFGPFGSFYTGFGIGLIMCVIYICFMFGSIPGIIIASIVNMIVCHIMINEHNEKLKQQLKHDKLNGKKEDVDPASYF